MEVTDRFVIKGSTKKKLETFIKNTRRSWGVKLHEDYDVRVLPDVKNNEIYSIQLAIEEGGEECDFIFQRNNVYYIAWGKPGEMMIFEDAVSNFKKEVEEEVDSDPDSRGRNNQKAPLIVRDESRERTPTQTSQSGRQYQLSKALASGISYDYRNLEEKGGLREEVMIGKQALENALYAFTSPFIPVGKAKRDNYVQRICKSTLVVLHTLPEPLRNEEICTHMLGIYELGGRLPRYVVELDNKWSNYSDQIHHSLPNPNETQKEHLKNLKLIMRPRPINKEEQKQKQDKVKVKGKGKGKGSKR